jgi:hypothetical protein
MKHIVLRRYLPIILLASFITHISAPAHAEVCSNGTYNVAGINTFGELPCTDPGTAIDVTVRGLHNYGVSGGPTGYCSFHYVRRNLGTVASPNWSASTDTVCDPRPTPTPTPTPTVVRPSPTPSPTPTVDEFTLLVSDYLKLLSKISVLKDNYINNIDTTDGQPNKIIRI